MLEAATNNTQSRLPDGNVGSLSLICLNLPIPPSMNEIWKYGNKRVYKSPRYERWIEAAGYILNTQKAGQEPIKGHFQSYVILSEKQRDKRSDLDNRTKALYDLLERHGIIENDKLQDEMWIQWGPEEEAPMGCRVYIWKTGGLNVHERLHIC